MLQQLLGKVNDFKPIGFSEGTPAHAPKSFHVTDIYEKTPPIVLYRFHPALFLDT
jgi:hypothetical protein